MKFLLSAAILILLISCVNLKEKEKTQAKSETFKIRDNNADFLFSDYWADMSEIHWQIITDSLLQINELEQIDEKTLISFTLQHEFMEIEDKSRFHLKPIFDHSLLKGISLEYFDQVKYINRNPGSTIDFSPFVKNLLELICKKYGQPKIVDDPDVFNDYEYLWILNHKVIEISFFIDTNTQLVNDFQYNIYSKSWYDACQKWEQARIEKAEQIKKQEKQKQFDKF